MSVQDPLLSAVDEENNTAQTNTDFPDDSQQETNPAKKRIVVAFNNLLSHLKDPHDTNDKFIKELYKLKTCKDIRNYFFKKDEVLQVQTSKLYDLVDYGMNKSQDLKDFTDKCLELCQSLYYGSRFEIQTIENCRVKLLSKLLQLRDEQAVTSWFNGSVEEVGSRYKKKKHNKRIILKIVADASYEVGLRLLVENFKKLFERRKLSKYEFFLWYYAKDSKEMLRIIKEFDLGNGWPVNVDADNEESKDNKILTLFDTLKKGNVGAVKKSFPKDPSEKRKMMYEIRASSAFIELLFETSLHGIGFTEAGEKRDQITYPINLCLELITELRGVEDEEPDFFMDDYKRMQEQVESYMCGLLDQVETFKELKYVLQFRKEYLLKSLRSNLVRRLSEAADLGLMDFVLHRKSQSAIDYLMNEDSPFPTQKAVGLLKLFFWSFVLCIFYPLLYTPNCCSSSQVLEQEEDGDSISTTTPSPQHRKKSYMKRIQEYKEKLRNSSVILLWTHVISEFLFLIVILVNVLAEKSDINALRIVTIVIISVGMLILIWNQVYRWFYRKPLNFLEIILMFLFILILVLNFGLPDLIGRNITEAFACLILFLNFVYNCSVVLAMSLIKSCFRVAKLFGQFALVCAFVYVCFMITFSKLFWSEQESSCSANNACTIAFPYSNVTNPLEKTLDFLYLFGGSTFADTYEITTVNFFGILFYIAFYLSFFIVLLGLFNALLPSQMDKTLSESIRRWNFEKNKAWIKYLRRIDVDEPMSCLSSLFRCMFIEERQEDEPLLESSETKREILIFFELTSRYNAAAVKSKHDFLDN